MVILKWKAFNLLAYISSSLLKTLLLWLPPLSYHQVVQFH